MYHVHFNFDAFFFVFAARRRVAAKRKKLKNLGKSKSTDTEDEEADDDCGDEGKLQINLHWNACRFLLDSFPFMHSILIGLVFSLNDQFKSFCSIFILLIWKWHDEGRQKRVNFVRSRKVTPHINETFQSTVTYSCFYSTKFEKIKTET